MKIVIISLIVILTAGAVIYFAPFDTNKPKNYEECVITGGKTNKDQMRVQDTCTYKGKTYLGPIF